MTLTIELPDALASQFVAQTTEEERKAFFADAVADALTRLSQEEYKKRFGHDGTTFVGGKPLSKEEQEAEKRLLAVLCAEFDPEKEPERDAAECKAAVEAAIADMDAGGKSYTLEEMRELWEAEKAARLAAKSA